MNALGELKTKQIEQINEQKHIGMEKKEVIGSLQHQWYICCETYKLTPAGL